MLSRSHVPTYGGIHVAGHYETTASFMARAKKAHPVTGPTQATYTQYTHLRPYMAM